VIGENSLTHFIWPTILSLADFYSSNYSKSLWKVLHWRASCSEFGKTGIWKNKGPFCDSLNGQKMDVW
jgi:hypothetical protein